MSALSVAVVVELSVLKDEIGGIAHHLRTGYPPKAPNSLQQIPGSGTSCNEFGGATGRGR